MEVIAMTVKTVSSKANIVSRKKGQNSVEKSAYISRTTIKCERDGQTYYPKYSEDLVYSEVMLPEGAPEKLKDRAVLWSYQIQHHVSEVIGRRCAGRHGGLLIFV